MNALHKNPTLRLALRAAVAAIGAVAAKYLTGETAGRALIVAAVLAFAEIFTPLNALVGPFKQAKPSR